MTHRGSNIIHPVKTYSQVQLVFAGKNASAFNQQSRQVDRCKSSYGLFLHRKVSTLKSDIDIGSLSKQLLRSGSYSSISSYDISPGNAASRN